MDENPIDAKEQYKLGCNYSIGDYGLPKDPKLAFYWFSKAADQGHGRATYELSRSRCCSEDRAKRYGAKAVELLTEEAERGDAYAWYTLGVIYEYSFSRSVRIDKDKAAQCYVMAYALLTKAAEQGDAEAQFLLGQMCQYCLGIPIDNEAAVYWFRKAAEQGHGNAQTALGNCYGDGKGVPHDEEMRRFWYAKAAEQGNKWGKARLTDAERGCYVATCVYGSYDCPQVWTLRRYRDRRLSMSWFGRRFIQVYYAVSPTVVELFGDKNWFNGLCKPVIDNIVRKLQRSGIDGSPYSDV